MHLIRNPNAVVSSWSKTKLQLELIGERMKKGDYNLFDLENINPSCLTLLALK